MIARITAVALCIIVAGCAGAMRAKTETHLNTPLHVLDFNDMSDRYSERPTFVSLVERHQADLMLSINVDLFGQDSYLYIPREDVSRLLPLIDKYLEWREIANQRGERLDREIGEVDGWGSFNLKLSFFSGAADHHFLVIRQCVAGCISASNEQDFYFDARNARLFRDLLVGLRDGNLQMLDADQIYK